MRNSTGALFLDWFLKPCQVKQALAARRSAPYVQHSPASHAAAAAMAQWKSVADCFSVLAARESEYLCPEPVGTPEAGTENAGLHQHPASQSRTQSHAVS